ncbi:hypothetical protein HMPREF0742_02666 [Rothia aeria F0184]|uniref:Uncharacterized protein n=1 Tax=Rothia aeria F0184 TaxID=888019 RepID=U7UYT0_9MICC|nr:hypothetical protein HMPREF0742_02666 [Rothia aeria F0184]
MWGTRPVFLLCPLKLIQFVCRNVLRVYYSAYNPYTAACY